MADTRPVLGKCRNCGRKIRTGQPGVRLHECAACSAKHANAVPDYAEQAAAKIERETGKPRRTWEAYGDEHRAVNALLRRWAAQREAA